MKLLVVSFIVTSSVFIPPNELGDLIIMVAPLPTVGGALSSVLVLTTLSKVNALKWDVWSGRGTPGIST